MALCCESSSENEQLERRWHEPGQAYLSRAWDSLLMNIVMELLGIKPLSVCASPDPYGQDSFIVFPCLTRKALQLPSPLVSYLFNLQDPLCSNFAFSNFIFTFKVNVICQANHMFFGSLSVKLFLNLTFWGPILADLNSSLSSTISLFFLKAAICGFTA